MTAVDRSSDTFMMSMRPSASSVVTGMLHPRASFVAPSAEPFFEFPTKRRRAAIHYLGRLREGVFMNGHMIDYMTQLTESLSVIFARFDRSIGSCAGELSADVFAAADVVALGGRGGEVQLALRHLQGDADHRFVLPRQHVQPIVDRSGDAGIGSPVLHRGLVAPGLFRDHAEPFQQFPVALAEFIAHWFLPSPRKRFISPTTPGSVGSWYGRQAHDRRPA